MLRKAVTTKVPDVDAPPPAEGKPAATVVTLEEKADIIIEYLHRMDRRDRLRTIGGTIKGLILLIPTAILLASTWYVYQYGQSILEGMMKQAMQQSGKYSEESIGAALKQLQQYLKK